MKAIWSGNWSSGSITVSDLPYYNFFVMRPNGAATLIPVYRNIDSNQLRGVGMYPYTANTGSNAFYFYGVSATASGSTLSMVKAHAWSTYADTNGGIGNNQNVTISKIWGVL